MINYINVHWYHRPIKEEKLLSLIRTEVLSVEPAAAAFRTTEGAQAISRSTSESTLRSSHRPDRSEYPTTKP